MRKALMCGLLFVLPLVLLASPSAAEEDNGLPFEIEATPVGIEENAVDSLSRAVLDLPEIRERMQGIIYRVLAVEVNIRSQSQGERYAIQIYDYTNDQLLSLSGSMEDISPSAVFTIDDQPDPTFEEFLDAVNIIKSHPELGSAVENERLVPYSAMPILLNRTENTGKRVFPVGLRSADPSHPHEIVAVDMSRRKIERFPDKAPRGSLATARVCGPYSAGQGITRRGTPGSAELKISRGGETLWEMTVVRPSASSGRWGSGVEMRDIRYKGNMVMHRAHVPILNVDYVNNVCGPYRDPVNQENAFVASGTRITSGILRASSMPKTIFDTKDDRGNYWGVAIYEESNQVVIMSELSAGWYRYVSEFRFFADGTIKPVFKFDAVHNSCTCETHDHHAYWRFDFDIDGRSPNSVDVYGPGGWRTLETEERHYRRAGNQRWRIYNSSTNRGYEIIPGPYDAFSTTFGRGDAWVLRFNRDEIDDSAFGSSAVAKIDRFLNRESVRDTDLVFWYAGHVTHKESGVETPHIVGPTIRPWRRTPR
jgi:hypothetical protein